LTKIQKTPMVSQVLGKLLHRLGYALSASTSQSWAGCNSEDSPESEGITHAYVVEPGIRAKSLRDLRALVLVLVNEPCEGKDGYLIYDAIHRKVSLMKDESWNKLKIALEFLLDRRFNEKQPIKEAVNAILHFTHRSYDGNDRQTGLEILKRTWLKVRALQRSKVKRLGAPKRPKEVAEPTHEWLPSWQTQYQSVEEPPEPETPIWELLSPVEVAFHFSR